ncbi:MAG: phosphate ABC transporter permease PstA [Acidimicrobiaceae bacterium]|nr:phosphate ABC transporter permease PstA [Acidimicrobiaceae bacterium]
MSGALGTLRRGRRTKSSTLEAISLRRRLTSNVMVGLMWLAVVIAFIPLVLVTEYTIQRGVRGLTGGFFTKTLAGLGPLDHGGGAAHAIVGTLEQVAIATAISVPIGILVAIDLTEYNRGVFSRAVRYFVDVMTGLPSIVAGLFIFTFWVIGLHRGFSGFAAALSLTVLMLPIVIRSTEEMLKLVSDELRESSLALGVRKWRTIVSIVLPTASAGIVTGIMLAVARVMGETAPLLLTAFGTQSMNTNAFSGPQSSLPLFVYQQAGSAFAVNVDRAWAGALTLIIVVIVLNVGARLLARRNRLT